MKPRNDFKIHPSAWHHHPAVRTGERLTLGERAADKLRNGMGSWGFVFGALVFLAGWMTGNRNIGFDKYPFILLNLILSCLAAMQGAILLIVQMGRPPWARSSFKFGKSTATSSQAIGSAYTLRAPAKMLVPV